MVKISEISVGQEFTTVFGPIKREMHKAYADASGDKNPIHVNDDFATNIGKLGGVITHGMFSYAQMTRAVVDFIGGNGKIIKIRGEFRGMVRPGDIITTVIKVEEIDGKKVILSMNQHSKTKVKIEKDGAIVEKFEAEEKGWISEKDIKKDMVKTEDVPEGILTFRLRQSIPGTATVELLE